MKKILVLLLAAGMFTACNNDKGVTRDDDRLNTRDDRNREKGDDDYDNRGDDNYETRNTKNKSNSKGWTSADRNEWRTACNQQIGQSVANARDLCDCVLTKLEAEYSNYREADAKGGEAAGRRMMEECVQMNGGGNRQYGGEGGYENEEDY
jgi:hypothetical protein